MSAPVDRENLPAQDGSASSRWAGADGYGARRRQLAVRELVPPAGQESFFDVDHVCDHLATLQLDDGLPAALHESARGIFNRDRSQLLRRIRGAHTTHLSAGTGLLAVQFGRPRRWQVIHTRSGVSASYLEDHSYRGAPWTRLGFRHTDGLDLSSATVASYLTALEGIPSITGRVIDWTTGLDALTQQLRRWRDASDTGQATRPGTLHTGMTGLHLAALLHAIADDPVAAASTQTVLRAVELLTQRADTLLVRGRPARQLFDSLRHLDGYYNHGRRRPDHDLRTRAQLAADRDTGRAVTIARLYAWTGEPHRAVDLLRQRADHVAPDDHNRRDGLGASALTSTADSIAVLFSPAPTNLERLRVAQAGDSVIEPATHDPACTPPERIWRILTPAHHVTSDELGVENFDVLAHDEAHHQVARIQVRPAHPSPLRIEHSTRHRWSHHIPNQGWTVWPADAQLPTTSSAVIAAAASVTRAFDRDRPH